MPRLAKRKRFVEAIPQSVPRAHRELSPTSEAGGEDDPYRVTWRAPASPFGLIEEELYEDPWKLLIACLFLNKTSITQVRGTIWEFFRRWPDANSAVEASISDLYEVLQPLGLGKKRAQFVRSFSHDYLHKQWRDPRDFKGMGTYASDAYFIFCKVLSLFPGKK